MAQSQLVSASCSCSTKKKCELNDVLYSLHLHKRRREHWALLRATPWSTLLTFSLPDVRHSLEVVMANVSNLRIAG